MVIDTSAIIAILRKEDEAGAMVAVLEKNPTYPVVAAAPTYIEAFTVMFGRYGESGANELNQLARDIGLVIEAFHPHLVNIACDGFRRYRRGKYGLNMGDCFAYALAKARNEPLLCKGEDFKNTDISIVQY